MDERPWRALHVMANHEKRVTQNLAVRSLDCYLPLYTERSQWTDRTVTLQRPLFPGYVFVRSSVRQRLSIISTPGVLRLLGDGYDETISAEEIARIRDGLAKGYALRPHPMVSVGIPVRVRDGFFAGAEGVVTELRHRCKVVIMLMAVKQSFSLEIDLRDIDIVEGVLKVSASAQRSGISKRFQPYDSFPH